jgi:choline dehydrogenase-like flavoprotein
MHYDAIVVGSGATGGYAAKELTERGLRVLMLERGRHVEHVKDYTTEPAAPWDLPMRGLGVPDVAADPVLSGLSPAVLNEYNQHYFARYADAPYQTAEGRPFSWVRGHQLGGKSLIWSRGTARWSERDFKANQREGIGTPWPIGYDDLKPWYDRVERFIGVSGENVGSASWPDGQYQRPMPLNAAELHLQTVLKDKFAGRVLTVARTANLTEPLPGRAVCQSRDHCARGCSYGAYFCTQSSTLPAARATGRLTLKTDALVERIELDAAGRRARAVQVVDTRTGKREVIAARLIVLCASTLSSVQILFNSRHAKHSAGLGNHSDRLGRAVMDHAKATVASGLLWGFDDRMSSSGRPAPSVMPPFRNIAQRDSEAFSRSYFYQVIAFRLGFSRGAFMPGVGNALKASLRRPGAWALGFEAAAECLPYDDNRATLHGSAVDRFGIPQLQLDVRFRDAERAALRDARDQALAMCQAAQVQVTAATAEPGTPGRAVHEVGGAAMGEDPAQSVLNRWNQVHGVANVIVTDGSAWCSNGAAPPTLTLLALTARACDHAASQLKAGRL